MISVQCSVTCPYSCYMSNDITTQTQHTICTYNLDPNIVVFSFIFSVEYHWYPGHVTPRSSVTRPQPGCDSKQTYLSVKSSYQHNEIHERWQQGGRLNVLMDILKQLIKLFRNNFLSTLFIYDHSSWEVHRISQWEVL